MSARAFMHLIDPEGNHNFFAHNLTAEDFDRIEEEIPRECYWILMTKERAHYQGIERDFESQKNLLGDVPYEPPSILEALISTYMHFKTTNQQLFQYPENTSSTVCKGTTEDGRSITVTPTTSGLPIINTDFPADGILRLFNRSGMAAVRRL
jgi:hypothetical protein